MCTTTLWVGHLSKLVQQEELSDTFGKYGDIVSIDMIPPRGCAFIVMHRRQDAHRSMQGLKGHKMSSRNITISWAAGKGVKSKEWKDFWDIELGVSYIPWQKLDRDTDFVALEEGGMFDEDSMPVWMKEAVKKPTEEVPAPLMPEIQMQAVIPSIDTSHPPPMGGPQMVQMVNPFAMGPVRLLPPPPGLPPILPGVPMMNVPPPGMMMPGITMPPPALPAILPFVAPPPREAINHQMPDDHMEIDEDEKQEIPQFSQPPPNPILGTRRGDFERERDDRRDFREREKPDFRGRERDERDSRMPDRDNDRGRGGRGGRNDRWNSRERENDRDRDSFQRDNRDHQRDQRDNRGGQPDRRNDRGGERPLQDRLRDLAGVGDGRNQGGNQQRDFMNCDGGRGNRMDGPPMRDFNRMDEGNFDRRGFQQQNRFPMRGGPAGPQFGNRGPGGQFMRGPRPGK